MKTLFLIATLIISCMANAFEGKDTDNEMTVIANLLMQKDYTTSDCTTETVQSSLNINGKQITEIINPQHQLICFGRIIASEEIPAQIFRKIKNQFGNCNICNAGIFTLNNGSINYYVCLKKGNNYTLVKISPEYKILLIKKIISNPPQKEITS